MVQDNGSRMGEGWGGYVGGGGVGGRGRGVGGGGLTLHTIFVAESRFSKGGKKKKFEEDEATKHIPTSLAQGSSYLPYLSVTSLETDRGGS